MFPSLTNYLSGSISNLFRKHLFLPATFRKKKAQEFSIGVYGFFDGLIPTRLETIIVVIFVVLTGLFSALHIHHVKDNPQYATKNAELGHLIADRTGILGTFLIPLLILFGGRNNFLQWLTGWDFATFIIRKCYEVFFLIHIVLVVFFVVGGYYHLESQGYGDFMWAAIAVWAFDRVVRLGRIFFFGARKATVSIKGDDTLKIEVPKPKYWKSVAGGHAFIHFLKPTLFLQSHPFTFTTTESNDKIVLYAKIKNGITSNIAKYLSPLPGNTATIRVLVEGPYGEPSSAGRNCKNVVFVAGVMVFQVFIPNVLI
ncbi:FAD-binding domain family protein [Candida albicans]|uniref:FAD-binding domain family protein n=1 Tax=Candida albicans TaxID=5476 RepID=A0A8H6F529_CANAX|nr:FAD-binding domain family protein [Candida albicans]